MLDVVLLAMIISLIFKYIGVVKFLFLKIIIFFYATVSVKSRNRLFKIHLKPFFFFILEGVGERLEPLSAF